MPNIPRRLPPTPEERLAVITTRMAGGSNAGSTRWAQPLNSSNYRAQVADDPVELPKTTGPEIHTSALTQRDTYAQGYSGDPDAYSIPLAVTGLQHGHVYLFEAVFYISTDYGQAGSNVLNLRLDPNAPLASASEMWLEGYGLATSVGYPGQWAPLNFQPEESGVAVNRLTFTCGIAYGDPAETVDIAIQTQVAQAGPDAIIRAGSFIRATYVANVVIDT